MDNPTSAGGPSGGGGTTGNEASSGGSVGTQASSDGGSTSSGDTSSDSDSGGTSSGGSGGNGSGGDNTSASGGAAGTAQNTVSSTGGVVDDEVRAFPGAEGFGAMVTGGRGGRVLKVTTLDAAGPGSLQAALDESGPRIVVFDVSGVIDADIIEIRNGDLTIAGQTAPGAGITLQGRLFGAYDENVRNIIIRHLRVRPEYDGSAGEQFDSIQLSRNRDLILDHVSVAFGVDEIIDLYSASDVTVQWSTIESAGTVGHPEGEHNYGLINGPEGRRLSLHHNLFAHNKNRNPAIANGPAEVRNNVMYNVRHGFIHHNPATGPFNLVGNYFKEGNDDTLIPFYFDDENDEPASDLAYFVDGNWVSGQNAECPAGALNDPWTQCDNDLIRDSSFRAPEELDFSDASGFRPVTTTTAAEAYAQVLASAGAFPRDGVTLRSVSETESGTGSWGARMPVDLMAGLTPSTPVTDADADGIADDWELSHGLDPSDGSDHSQVMPSGYTAIEAYINEVADSLLDT